VIHVRRRFGAHKISNRFRIYASIIKDFAYRAGLVLNHFSGESFVFDNLCFCCAVAAAVDCKRLASLLERMAEGTMPDIVKKRGKQGYFCPLFIEGPADALKANFSFYDLHKSSRTMKNTNRMGKSRMVGRWKNELRNSELFDSSQTLHIGSLEEFPYPSVDKALVIEDDQVMNWIA